MISLSQTLQGSARSPGKARHGIRRRCWSYQASSDAASAAPSCAATALHAVLSGCLVFMPRSLGTTLHSCPAVARDVVRGNTETYERRGPKPRGLAARLGAG